MSTWDWKMNYLNLCIRKYIQIEKKNCEGSKFMDGLMITQL